MKIGIIQISDIHNSNRDKFSKVEELNSVLNAHYLSHCDSIFLVINGDMAFSGRKEEYSESELQILEIKDAIEEKLKVSCDVYCIPGNHDCDFSIKCLWQDKPTYNCSAKVHNSASSLGQKKKPLRAS